METFGAYRVVSLLGEGGMGAVYLGEHSLLGRRAAIKVLRAELSQREEVVERFFNEARAASSIADPGIIQIFDFGYEGSTAYIVMEFLEGESLDARLERLGRLPSEEVARIGRQLALSLQAAHCRGVIHRDLKPENVFLVPDAEVEGGERTKLLDFGIAKLTDDKRSTRRTEPGMVFGTPLYMSPEQSRGTGAVDHRSDIYSLGCVLFHLACGRPPFDAEGPGELLAFHLTAAPPRASELVDMPPYLEQILATCLAKRPAQRFASMSDLAAALVEPPIAVAVGGRSRGQRWPIAAAIGGVLGAGAVIGALTLHDGEASPPARAPAAALAVPAPAAAVPVAAQPLPPPGPEPAHIVQPVESEPALPVAAAARAVAEPPVPAHRVHSHRAVSTPIAETTATPGPVTEPEPVTDPENAPQPEPAPAPAPVPPPDDPYGDR